MIFGLHGCVGDADGDGITNVDDLLVVLGFWGTAHAGADLNDDGTVDVNDLLMLLGDWGCGDPGAGPFPESFSECLQTYSDPAKQAACIEALIHTGQY
jgi:hypothetical protein